MTPVSSKVTHRDVQKKGEAKGAALFPFDVLAMETVTAPAYRSLTAMFLNGHRNTSALVQLNRKLIDEFRDIARQQQDFMLDFSEKLLSQTVENVKSSEGVPVAPGEAMEQYFETALGEMGELGTSLADAQMRSIEALQTHTHDLVKMGEHSIDQLKAAAE